MKPIINRLLERLYQVTNDLGAYSHYLSATSCNNAFISIRDVVLAIKTSNDEQCDAAKEALEKLEKLANYAKNGNCS